jgi:hypothetical protein
MVSPWYQHRNNTRGPTDTIWYHALSAVVATLEMLLERERERERGVRYGGAGRASWRKSICMRGGTLGGLKKPSYGVAYAVCINLL